MSDKIVNIFISAVVGCLSAVGTLWLFGDPKQVPGESEPAQVKVPERLEDLEVERLKVTGGIWVCHSETGEPLIELKDGVVLAKNEVLSRFVGGMEMVGRKLQITTGDPSAADPPIFCELGASDGSQGAYIALLSPKGTHSVNIGFDRNETGFIVSRNNEDSAMTAQAVLPLPKKDADPAPAEVPAEAAKPEAEAEAESEQTAEAEQQAKPEAEPEPELKLEPELSDVPKPERLAMNTADAPPAERKPGGLPMLTPAKPK